VTKIELHDVGTKFYCAEGAGWAGLIGEPGKLLALILLTTLSPRPGLTRAGIPCSIPAASR